MIRWECGGHANPPTETEAYNATADIWSLGITCIEMVWMPRIDPGLKTRKNWQFEFGEIREVYEV